MMTDPGQPARDARQLLSGTGGRLACGADVDELLEQAADGHAGQLTEHQRDASHCQAALQEFSRSGNPCARLAAEHVAVPAALKAAVATRSASSSPTSGTPSSSPTAEPSASPPGSSPRSPATPPSTVPGVRVAFGRSTHSTIAGPAEKATLRHRHPHSAVGVLGRTAVVDLAIAVQYGDQLDTVAREVQQRAIAELRTRAGLRTSPSTSPSTTSSPDRMAERRQRGRSPSAGCAAGERVS